MASRLTIAQTSNRILWNISHGYEAYGAGKFCPSKKPNMIKCKQTTPYFQPVHATVFKAISIFFFRNCCSKYIKYLVSIKSHRDIGETNKSSNLYFNSRTSNCQTDIFQRHMEKNLDKINPRDKISFREISRNDEVIY